jgi:5-methylcytosine-specific restriction endonuclease McrA
MRKSYNILYQSINYEVHGDLQRQRVKERKSLLRQWVNSLKDKCKKCESLDDLEFHHIDPLNKFKNIADMVSDGHSKERILEEIKKCMVLCKKCHSEITYGT